MAKTIEILKETYGDNANVLDNGNLMVRDYGKYKSRLCYLISPKNAELFQMENKELESSMNIIWDGEEIRFTPGDFWTSKKGTKMFTVKPDGNHLLVEMRWGGSLNTTRGYIDDMIFAEKAASQILYQNIASSGGGGCGHTYFVVPRNFRQEIELDDII